MKILYGTDPMFLKSTPEVVAKVYVKNRTEFYELADQNGKAFLSCTYDLGGSVVDALYDPSFEQVTGFLQVSESIVSNIKQGIDAEKEWRHFDVLAGNLYDKDSMHPMYYPLFAEVISAYKHGMCDEQGRPLPDDHFVQIGAQLERFKQRLQELLDAQDETLDGEAANDCYKRKAFSKSLPIKNLQVEMLPIVSAQDGKATFEIVAALFPESLDDFWAYLLANYAFCGVRFKRCENCKRFFATTGRGNPKFCERMIEGKGKTCRQLMPKLNFNSKAEKDPAVWLYNRAYKTMYSRVTAGTLPKENFKEWAKIARVARDECSRGEMSAEDYSAWLCNNGLFIDYLKES